MILARPPRNGAAHPSKIYKAVPVQSLHSPIPSSVGGFKSCPLPSPPNLTCRSPHTASQPHRTRSLAPLLLTTSHTHNLLHSSNSLCALPPRRILTPHVHARVLRATHRRCRPRPWTRRYSSAHLCVPTSPPPSVATVATGIRMRRIAPSRDNLLDGFDVCFLCTVSSYLVRRVSSSLFHFD